jgi:hypothetical protein
VGGHQETLVKRKLKAKYVWQKANKKVGMHFFLLLLI